MLDVIGDNFDGGFAGVGNKVGREVNHDDGVGLAFACADHAEDVVRHVALVRVHGTRGGVRPDHGCLLVGRGEHVNRENVTMSVRTLEYFSA